MASCSTNDDVTKTLKFDVQVTMPTGFKSDAYYAEQTVNLSKGSAVVYTAKTDEKGVAHFENVIPDVYDISTSCEISGDDYVNMAESDVENRAVLITGSMLQQTVVTEDPISLTTQMSLKQSLLISKIYYAGCKDNLLKSYTADQYIEFFNNSDEDIYVDGLYFALTETESTAAFPAISHNDTVYVKQIFQFPGSGQQYKVAAGGTILVANSAIDHTASASSSVNLTSATFEAKDPKKVNNPSTPALNLTYTAYSGIPSMNLLAGGDATVVLFKTTEDVSKWETVYKPGATSGNLYKKVPTKTVIDGLECLKNKATTGPDTNSKRLYNYIDAGYQFINAVNGYNSEVVTRAKDKEANGRVYLKDSNNSTNDFTVSATVKPGQYLTK
jgi:hypothetical protein